MTEKPQTKSEGAPLTDFTEKLGRSSIGFSRRISRLTGMLNRNKRRAAFKERNEINNEHGSDKTKADERLIFSDSCTQKSIIIGEPQLESDSVMIDSRQFAKLNHKASFRKSNIKALDSSPVGSDQRRKSSLANLSLIERVADSSDKVPLPTIESTFELPSARIMPGSRRSSGSLLGLFAKFEEIKVRCHDVDQLSPTKYRLEYTIKKLEGENSSDPLPINLYRIPTKKAPTWYQPENSRQYPTSPNVSLSLSTSTNSNSTVLHTPQTDEKCTVSTLNDQFELVGSSNSTLPTDLDEDEFEFDNLPQKQTLGTTSTDVCRKYSIRSTSAFALEDLKRLKQSYVDDESNSQKQVDKKSTSSDEYDLENGVRSISTWRPSTLVSRATRKEVNELSLLSDHDRSYTNVYNQSQGVNILEKRLSSSQSKNQITEFHTQMQSLEAQYRGAKIRHLRAREKSDNAKQITGLPRILPLTATETSQFR